MTNATNKPTISLNLMTNAIRDVVATKRVIKWGYVRSFGGLYPSQCDTVAAHSGTVTALANILAFEYEDVIHERFGYRLDIKKIAIMSSFHDFGEGRSGDTGASSHGIRGVCELHSLEAEGLSNSLEGLKIHDYVKSTFDEYRKYLTPEALIVHMADNIEGLEKALHASSTNPNILKSADIIAKSNISIYLGKNKIDEQLGVVAAFLVFDLLLPAMDILLNEYGVDIPNDTYLRFAKDLPKSPDRDSPAPQEPTNLSFMSIAGQHSR